MDKYEWWDECSEEEIEIEKYNCPDCNEAKLQSDKNARKINEVIDQVNALIQVNNETVDFIEEKTNDLVEDLTTEVENINSTLDNLENEVNELKEDSINYATKSELSTKADKSELHLHTNKTVLDNISSEKVTEWNNKSTFSGNYNDLTNKPTIPSLNGYATEQYVNEELKKIDVTEQLTDYAKKSELHSHSNKNVLDGITSNKITEWNNKSNFSGNYNNLTNKPTIPTKTSQLSNDSGFITSIPIVQESGDSEKLIMSQKAVTDFVRNTINDNNNSGYERVDSIDEMIDTSKQYILNSTNTIWVYKETDEGEPIELYEPSKITLNQRYSGTPGKPTTANGFFITDYIPIVNNGSPKLIITDDTGGKSTSNTPSLQKCIAIDKNLNSIASLYCYGFSNQNDHWYATKSDKTITLDLSKRANGSAFEHVNEIKYVRIDVRVSSSSITSSESRLIASIKDPNNTAKVSEWVDTGMSEGNYDYAYLHELINETNMSLDNLENEIENLKQSDGEGLVPSYVISESEIVAEKVLGVRNSDSFVMCCASDLHTTGSDISAIGITHMGMAMNEINKITQLDLVMIFGDIIVNRFDDNHKKGFIHVKKSIDEVRKAVPYIQMQGNHDELPADTTEQGRQKYYAYIGANNVGVTTDYSNKFRNYGYKDFDNYKMRVIYLNSADVSDGEITTDVNISYEQFNWFINIALDFSTKDSEWKFIVCSHHPLNWYGTSMPNLLTILDSYKGKTSGSINVSGKSIAYNFTTTKATLIAHFHGHLHNFRSETLGTNNVLSITIPNACFSRNNEYGTSSSYGETEHINYGDVDENGVQRKFNKTSGSSDDTSFNVIVIDKLNSKIHCFNYGAGIDRIIDFEGGVEPSVPDTPSGGYTNIIDSVGYMDDTRISTSSMGTTKTSPGYVCTNIFDISRATKPTTIRTKGVNFSNSQSAITLFDGTGKATYAYLVSDLVKGLNVNITATLDTSNNLTMIVKEENANMTKIQISGLGKGSNLIVTINQEIT